MKRTVLASALLAALGLIPAERAEAQIFNNPSRTYGVGSTTGSGSRFQGLGIFNRSAPAASSGTYTAPDNRLTNVAPSYGMGLGWFGKRSPSPRPDANFQYNPPVPFSTAEPPLDGAPEEQPVPEAPKKVGIPEAPKKLSIPEEPKKVSLFVEVRVPLENAEVFINNTLTKQTGLVRSFESPQLPHGEKYQYEIRAQWQADGQKVSKSVVVTGKPGDRLLAEFVK